MERILLSVSAFVQQIKNVVDEQRNLQSICIKGEISNYTNHKSGHWYFTLKDASSKIACVMFASHASKCNLEISEGMQVIIEGNASVYVASGSLQVYVSAIKLDGLGDLFIRFEALKKQLASEGLFAQEHKKSLPQFPQSIGIISAKEGAAIHDVWTTISQRWPLAECTLYPSLVQGRDAATQLIKALSIADKKQHDVILLVRGGGAMEDLWCFNDESLARYIYQMETVVVSGVGHENDITLVDYVCDYRSPTPTGAAQMVTPQKNDVQNQCLQYFNRMIKSSEHVSSTKASQLAAIKAHRYLKNPLEYVQQDRLQLALIQKRFEAMQHVVQQNRQTLRQHHQKIAYYVQSTIRQNRERQIKYQKDYNNLIKMYYNNKQQQLHNNISLLDAYSPLKVLGRGYSIVTKEHLLIRSIKAIEDNDKLSLRFADGIVKATVTNKENLK